VPAFADVPPLHLLRSFPGVVAPAMRTAIQGVKTADQATLL